jgi:UDP-N-acetylglucosamine/UDP-N-acetylgalactosamine diphosphorylase
MRRRLAAFGQDHVLQDAEELTPGDLRRLLRDLLAIDLERLQRLWQTSAARLRTVGPGVSPLRNLVARPHTSADFQRFDRARRGGEEWLRQGRVAALLVAGGEGTRLGVNYPKGAFPIGPVSGRSLYQILAERVTALCQRLGVAIPYLVMTSDATDLETRDLFERHNYFGLEPARVRFLRQGTMPAVDRETGKMLMAGPGALALSPDGHGGVIDALTHSGSVDFLRQLGVEHLYYHQVDNPLARVCDPEFLGLHREFESEASTKVVSKLHPTEKMGALVEINGQIQIVEYSDLTPSEAAQPGPHGGLLYGLGNTAMHVFSLELIERLSASGGRLPFHCSHKVVPHLDESGQLVQPSTPNAIKFERFVFDILPAARNALVVETDRAEEFCPLKNQSGEFSPEHVRAAMVDLHRRWLEQSGTRVAPGVRVEISPLRALDLADLANDPHRPEVIDTDTFLGPEGP